MDRHPTMPPIPFRRQETGWTCGAASLRMVFASYGLEVSEAEVWSSLKTAPLDRSGVRASRLAWEALRRGFPALAIRARSPWVLIRSCAGQGVRVVFQHPLRRGSPRRHFSVLARVDADSLVLHDPQHGADLPFEKAEWLELWGATYGNPRAETNELVAIAAAPAASSSCPACGFPIPASLPCPHCKDPIVLSPAFVLGCIAPGCPARSWERLSCPACDCAVDHRGDRASDGGPSLVLEETTMFNGNRPGDLGKAMQDYQKILKQAHGATPDPGLREMLASLQTVMKDSTEKLVESLDRLDEQAKERAKQILEQKAEGAAKLEEAQKAREQALAQLAAKRAAKAARPVPRKEAVDPHLGEKLRDKLLEEFGTRVEARPSGASGADGSLLDFDPGA